MSGNVPGPGGAEQLRVPVAGGELTVLRWAASSPDAPVVLALHGITANALAWLPVARALAGRATLLAPDLRGRAGSAGLPGPYGIDRHVADVAAVAAARELAGDRPVRLTGHSMGAFVAARTLAVHPELASSVLLIDGGVGFPAPTHLSADELLTAVIGPAMTRLAMTFESPDAYLAFWRAHPALGPWWSAELAEYVLRDLVGEASMLRSSCVPDAIRADGTGLFAEEVLAAVHGLPVPGRLLLAERGLMDEPQALLDLPRLALAGVDTTRLPVEVLPDTNHYTVLMSEAPAKHIADLLADG